MFNNFKSKFKFACTHVLPLVFDSSISYYETLCKLTKKSNEIIEQVNKNTIRLEGIIDSDKFVVDQRYDPTSSDAQSGKAVAEAINDAQISIPIDQTYDPESSNPQSGTAVAEAIEEISEAKLNIDQSYNPLSVNAQSGTAVAEAISRIEGRVVDQEYRPLSTNAQSGKAVFEGIQQAIDDLDIPTPNTVDQDYDPESSNPQSGTAVAEALSKIEGIKVDQAYRPLSTNAQSGKAVFEGIQQAIYDLDIPTPNTVDQTYDPESSNPQSGTAVAEAIESIEGAHVDQSYQPLSANAQSGKAVEEGIRQAIDGLIIPTPNEVDQTFDPESSNPQSGTAVAEAISQVELRTSPFTFIKWTQSYNISKWESVTEGIFKLNQDILLDYYNEYDRYFVIDFFGRVYAYKVTAGVDKSNNVVNMLELYHYGDPTDSTIISSSSGFSFLIFKINTVVEGE